MFHSRIVSKHSVDNHNASEEKASVSGTCLVSCSGSLRNILLASMIAFTRYSPLALGLVVRSQAVSLALTSVQITSSILGSG